MTSEIVDAFVDAGLADLGAYTAPGGSSIDCRVIVDRSVNTLGDYAKGERIGSPFVAFDITADGGYKIVYPPASVKSAS